MLLKCSQLAYMASGIDFKKSLIERLRFCLFFTASSERKMWTVTTVVYGPGVEKKKLSVIELHTIIYVYCFALYKNVLQQKSLLYQKKTLTEKNKHLI